MGAQISTTNDVMIEVIYLEGNIGCGKSSALTFLKSKGEITVPELVEEWTFLDEFYKDYKNAFQLQTEIAVSRREQLYRGIRIANQKGKNRVFVERNIKTGALFSEGLSSTERVVLNRLYSVLSSQEIQLFTERTIYFSVDPSLCWDRIQKRGRNAESTVNKDYIYRLHRTFETHFMPNIDATTLYISDSMDVNVVGKKILDMV
jgi:deoxyadenosine/deoxycytidine kinase